MTDRGNRRIIVGDSAAGRSAVSRDACDMIPVEPLPGFIAEEIWCERAVPAQPGDSGIRAENRSVTPPPGGVLVRILTVLPTAPGQEWVPNLHGDDDRHILTVTSGEVDLVLEDQVVGLRAGDTVVLSGNRHEWRNSGHPGVHYDPAGPPELTRDLRCEPRERPVTAG